MRITLKVSKFVILVMAAFFVLLAFDMFGGDESIWFKLAGFFISISPGVVLVVLVLLLWEKEKILGYIITPIALFMIYFFRIFEEFPEHLATLSIVGPILIAGILFIIYGKNTKKEE